MLLEELRLIEIEIYNDFIPYLICEKPCDISIKSI
jgi:hypothetical protein